MRHEWYIRREKHRTRRGLFHGPADLYEKEARDPSPLRTPAPQAAQVPGSPAGCSCLTRKVSKGSEPLLGMHAKVTSDTVDQSSAPVLGQKKNKHTVPFLLKKSLQTYRLLQNSVLPNCQNSLSRNRDLWMRWKQIPIPLFQLALPWEEASLGANNLHTRKEKINGITR